MKQTPKHPRAETAGPGARRVYPELLDELPASDPRASRSRADLQRVNWWMGNARVLGRALGGFSAQAFPPKLVELGGGDGTLMLEVARGLSRSWAGARLEIVDRQSLLTVETVAKFNALGWQVRSVPADVFAWLEQATAVDAVVCNLFLHHFENDRLKPMLEQIARITKQFAACEPRRYRFAGAAGRLVWLIGCNGVTRHDAVASVRAGFRSGELSVLWPTGVGWACQEGDRLFNHHFTAHRCLKPGS